VRNLRQVHGRPLDALRRCLQREEHDGAEQADRPCQRLRDSAQRVVQRGLEMRVQQRIVRVEAGRMRGGASVCGCDEQYDANGGTELGPIRRESALVARLQVAGAAGFEPATS